MSQTHTFNERSRGHSLRVNLMLIFFGVHIHDLGLRRCLQQIKRHNVCERTAVRVCAPHTADVCRLASFSLRPTNVTIPLDMSECS